MAKKKNRSATESKARRAAGEAKASEQSSALVGTEDADLSAFLDGELSPEDEAELRSRLTAEPSLAARCAELGEVSGHLRRLVDPEMRSEAQTHAEEARIEGMHAALRRRLEIEDAPGEDTEGARVIPLRPALGRFIPAAAAALAAGLVVYLGLGLGGFGGSDAENSGVAEEVAVVATDPPEGGAIDLEALPGNSAPPPSSDIAALETELEADAPVVQAESFRAVTDEDPVEVAETDPFETLDWAALDDEELAIALDFDVLADFDVIENLELLELLDELDTMEQI